MSNDIHPKTLEVARKLDDAVDSFLRKLLAVADEEAKIHGYTKMATTAHAVVFKALSIIYSELVIPELRTRCDDVTQILVDDFRKTMKDSDIEDFGDIEDTRGNS